MIEPVAYVGDQGFDIVSYAGATSGVTVDLADNLANDGRAGDRENLSAGFEHLNGSNFRDTLFGTPAPDGIAGGGERDIIAGGAGDDFFYSATKDGADDYHGGPGRDGIVYVGRTQPLTVRLDNIADRRRDRRVRQRAFQRREHHRRRRRRHAELVRRVQPARGPRRRGHADRRRRARHADRRRRVGTRWKPAAATTSWTPATASPTSSTAAPRPTPCPRDAGEGVVRSCETVGVGVLRLAYEAIDAEAGKATPASR